MNRHTTPISDAKVNIVPNYAIDRTNDTGDTEILRPTVEAYEALENAFDFFNLHLFVRQFGVELPHVMLTMPKHKRFQGYFQHQSWNRARDQRICASEIALNPQFFGSQIEVCQTLVHEMVHLAQAESPETFGSPSPRGYHNGSFARTMMTLGLMPSSTGKPGGQTRGIHMSDYVIEGGLFARTYERFVESGYGIRWTTLDSPGNPGNPGTRSDGSVSANNGTREDREREQKRRSKTKYSCAVCGLNAWAKPKAKLGCVACATVMREVAS